MLCTCHPLLLGPPWLCSNSFEWLRRISRRLQMTLVKLHACQYPKVKWFLDIGWSSDTLRVVRTAGGPTSPVWAALNSVLPGQPRDPEEQREERAVLAR
jgi:hypothetical protein